MRFLGSRRRMVNRRRRHRWLTARGRGFVAIIVLLVLAGVATQPIGRVWQGLADGAVLDVPAKWANLVGFVDRVSSNDPLEPTDVEFAESRGDVDPLSPVRLEPEDLPRRPSRADGDPPAVSSRPPLVASADRPFFDPPRSRERFELARDPIGMIYPASPPGLSEWRDPAEGDVVVATPGRVRVEYSLDESLTERIFKILRRGRVSHGHAIVLDPRDGRLLAYVSTDEKEFPAARAYPAASIVKILTASAVMEIEGIGGESECVYTGNKYRLNRRRLKAPKSGREATLESALASSNNQCFARWALHSVGEERLVEVLERFGWLSRPAPGHDSGELEPLESDLDLGRLGSGLDGVRVTPLHVAQMASILTHGEWVEPWWVERAVDAYGRSLPLPERRSNRRVLDPNLSERLRTMMVATTKRGTAKSAFRNRRGEPLVGPIDVAGKTGNLTGWDPYGRYEWFLGLAPAEDPTIGVVVLQLQSHMWWRRSTELASDVFKAVFCDDRGCRREVADRLTNDSRTPSRQLVSLPPSAARRSE